MQSHKAECRYIVLSQPSERLEQIIQSSGISDLHVFVKTKLDNCIFKFQDNILG
jgi:hypothetical protein